MIFFYNWMKSTGDLIDFPSHTTLEFLHKIQRKLGKDRVRPEELKDRIIILPTWVELTKDQLAILYFAPQPFP